MLPDLLSTILLLLFGYVIPAVECLKTVEARPIDARMLRFWCRYWIIVAMVIAFESLVSWMPMYGEIKIALLLYLWYPKTRGSDVVYDAFVRPIGVKYGPNIVQRLLHLRAKPGQVSNYVKNFAGRYVVYDKPEGSSAKGERRATTMETPLMVCYSRGVIDSLVDKLTDLKDTHPLVNPLLKDLVSLRDDLVNKYAGVTHWKVKVWMRQNRQLFYDIEDMIDLKTKDMDESVKDDFEEQIEVFKVRIKEAFARSERYDLPNKAPTFDVDRQQAAGPTKVPFDSKLICWEKKCLLVGIEGPRKELQEHLKEMQKKKMVVSILGMGGVGKTTLAMKLYEDLNGQFDCHASVTVGRNSPIDALIDVFLQVNLEMAGHALIEQEVISQLWEFLQNKRYFIFIDDIQNKHAWSIINCALPNNNLGSRILATTCVKDVAMSCSVPPIDVIYEMNGLDAYDSSNLLDIMIPAETEASCTKTCHNMLNICCGLPLAIIVTSGLLAMRSADSRSSVKLQESSLSTHHQYSMSEGMKNVLDICFADLSTPVKACFLYLSAFPENYAVNKGRLIRRWVAEGFIPNLGQASLRETGEGYFNELICRRLIWPVFDDCKDDQIVACKVHPVIHDFITSLSRQDGFQTTASELISGLFQYGTIRRLTVNCSRQENSESDTLRSSEIGLSRVRSLTVFGAAGSLPDIGTFKLLRVLDLEQTKLLNDQQAERIKLLFLLTYLGLAGTNITKLPKQIMELQHLATLDLRQTEVRKLPLFRNNKLQYLFGSFLIIQTEMGAMERLEELSDVLIGRDALLNLDGSNADAVSELVSKSKWLRVLGVKFGYLAEIIIVVMNRFLKEVKESTLESLSLHDCPSDLVATLVECKADELLNKLRKFELRICDFFPLVPEEMASIKALTHLHIQVKAAETEGIRTLGNLPNLILLKLYSEESSQERLSISSKDGFPCIKVFWFMSSYFHGMGLQFEAGAMPRLQRLKVEFNARKTKLFYDNYDFGIHHLSCLLEVHAVILCKGAKDSEKKAAEAAIRNQVSRIHHKDASDLEAEAAKVSIRDQVPQVSCGALRKHGDYISQRQEVTRNVANSTTSVVDIRISILLETYSHLPLPEIITFGIKDAMVSFSTGVMNFVLTKLRTLMLIGMDEQELMILRDELQLMNGLLKQISDTSDLDDEEMKECRNQMRELTYDIDDSIDDLMLPSVNKRSSEFTDKKVLPQEFLNQIQKLNSQVQTAELRSMVSKAGKCIFGPRSMPREQWLTSVYYYELEKLVETDEPSIESVRKIFTGLPTHTRTCLLYLSRFPCYDVLKKDQLIRMWAAEGFLPKGCVETWWETGENCFLELIICKLIEPVYSDNGEDVLPTGCKVSGFVHKFITSQSSEENFVTTLQPRSIWNRYETEQDEQVFVNHNKFSKVRSLTFDLLYTPEMLSLSTFKHLRVLDIKNLWGYSDHGQLRSVGCLSLLRYLGLGWDKLEFLPQEIIALEHLETVDLRHSSVKELPTFKSRKLISLIADNVRLPKEMGELQALEELSTVQVSGGDGEMLAHIVNKSKWLRRLGITIDDETISSALVDLLDAIGNSKIQALRLIDTSLDGSVLIDSLLRCWATQRPHQLQKLQLVIHRHLPEVPQNMSVSLIYLTHLSIDVERLNTEGLDILGSLTNLVVLSLCHFNGSSGEMKSSLTERGIISNKGFRCLKVLWYYSFCDGGLGLQFKAGAMPQLRRLHLMLTVSEETELDEFGIQFLTSLIEVHAIIPCEVSKGASAEAALRRQLSRNPKKPLIKVKMLEF